MRRSALAPAFLLAAACTLLPAYGQEAQRLVALTAQRVTTALGYTPLNPANNLSDLGAPATARTNLGLGTAATQATGTSGATVPLLNGANTWGATQTFGADAYFNNGTSAGVWLGLNGVSAPGGLGDKVILYGTAGTRATTNYSIGINSNEIYFNLANTSGMVNAYASGTKIGGFTNNGVTVPKLSAAPTAAPGAGYGQMFMVAGTNSGTCKLQVMAGTSTTPVTIVDNVGAGC